MALVLPEPESAPSVRKLSSSSSSSSSRRDRDRSVPTILESFPIPPTHIPSKLTSPTTPTQPSPLSASSNPPPSRPPSLPLPPVPGPSRISEHDTLLLLTSANSRRSSKYSATSDARRDSVASEGSSISYLGGRSPSRTSSSSRSTSRSIPLSKRPSLSSGPRPSIAFSISEEDAAEPSEHLGIEQLTRLAISPMPFSDDDLDLPLSSSPPLLPSSLRSRHRSGHARNDSISSMDIRDLPALDDDGPDPPATHVPPFNPFRPLSRPQQPPGKVSQQTLDVPHKLSITIPSRASHASLADPIDPHTITVHHCQPLDQDVIRPPVSPALSSAASTTLTLGLLSRAPFEPPVSPPAIIASPPSVSPPLSAALQPPQVMDPAFKPQELHRELRAVRSKSISHKQALRARSRSKSPSTARAEMPKNTEPVPDLPPPPTLPRPVKKPSLPPSSFKEPERSSSPDIESIISSTPRALRAQPSTHLSDLGANSKSARSSLASAGSRSRKNSGALSSSLKGKDMLDGDLHYVLGTWEGVDGEGNSDLEGGEESDSSIDLHTPLPHLMVKHGLLSPHSKLLPQADARSITPHNVDGRPGSTLSMNSTATKGGIMKDERNTPMRKERHRNGKLLRGGIGLTTGLGWSDSEDEDAPSPLTRRLSHLTMQRQSSVSSMRSSASYHSRSSVSTRHPLSRSYSGGTIDQDVDEMEDGVDEWGQRRPRTMSKGALPPTSWHGRSQGRNAAAGSRISTSSAGSASSTSNLKRAKSVVDQNQNQNQQSDDTLNTPSTASTLSIPLPTTPPDDLMVSLNTTSIGASLSRKGGKVPLDKEKSLPPLPLQPASILRKQSSGSTLSGLNSRQGLPRARTSSASAGLSTASTPSTPAAMAMKRVASPGPVRPLRLPQRIAGDRSPVPVPLISPSLKAQPQKLVIPNTGPALTPTRSVPGLSSSTSKQESTRGSSIGRVSASVPSSPTVAAAGGGGGLVKPKPRTGTGMVYRKSSSSTLSVGAMAGSRMRAPMPLAMASSATSGLSARARTPGPPTSPIGQAF